MSEENAPNDTNEPDLPAIDFQSPGRFAVHNPPNPPSLSTEPREPSPFLLGSHVELQRFNRPEQAQAHALALLQQARFSLSLYSPDLEAWLYSHSSVQGACTQFLLASPKNRLRILVRGVFLLLLVVLIFSINIAGDRLREILNPRLQGR
mgnify:CR=1 FL=1